MVRARVMATLVVGFTLMLQARPAAGQDLALERIGAPSTEATLSLMNASTLAAIRLANIDQLPISPIVPQRPKAPGGALMNSLYVSTAVVQVLDLHSTLKAFGAGATEGNPLMAGVTRNPATFAVTKAAVAAGTIFAAQKLAKKNKVAAVITLVAVNSAYAMIVSHNYALANR